MDKYIEGYDSELFYYSKALTKEIVRDFKEMLTKKYGKNYNKYNELFKTIKIKQIKEYDLSKYKRNSNFYKLDKVKIYGNRDDYAKVKEKNVAYSEGQFEVGGESKFEDQSIELYIGMMGYGGGIRSREDQVEMYNKLEDAQIHEFTHYWQTFSQDDEDIYKTFEKSDPFEYLLNPSEIESLVSTIRLKLSRHGELGDNPRKTLMGMIEEHFGDYINQVFMVTKDRKPTPEEKYLVIKNIQHYIKEEYTDFYYDLNQKEEKNMNNKIRFVLKENKVYGAAGVIGVNVRSKQVQVGLRSQTVSNPGVWVFPGGKVERGESFRKAAMREFSEESWYTGRFENLTRLYKQGGEFEYSLYIATVGNFAPKMDMREFDQMMWIDFEKFLSDVHPKHPRLEEALSDESNVKRIQNYIGRLM